MEKIIIENFGGLKKMEFEFSSVNILIGPQGSGKSITVKLLYFFKSFIPEIIKSIDNEETKRELDNRQKENFITFFPKESWPKGNFKISYYNGETIIIISRNENKLLFDYSENLKNILKKGRKIFAEERSKLTNNRISSFRLKRDTTEKIQECIKNEFGPISTYGQFFIPAGRSFFANIQRSIFSFLSDNRSLDPFLIEFGSFYENIKRIYKEIIFEKTDKEFDDLIAQILNSNYHREKDKDYLIHNDSRKVNLANASSGQQETLPLMIILKSLNYINSTGGGYTIYIEEPEAHLFPTAQKRIVQLLARTFNNTNSNFQIIVTTHSPYILSSFNNLIYAGNLTKIKPEKTNEINKIISPKEQLSPEILRAYSIKNGKNKNLIDSESKLISQTILDSVSDDISLEFDKLLEIEF